MDKYLNNTSEQFADFWKVYFNEDFKKDIRKAMGDPMRQLKKSVTDKVLNSGLRKSSELAKGIVAYTKTDRDPYLTKLHILGNKGTHGGYLRIFELGTYKNQNHKPKIRPRYFFTSSVAELKDQLPQQMIENIKQAIHRLNGK